MNARIAPLLPLPFVPPCLRHRTAGTPAQPPTLLTITTYFHRCSSCVASCRMSREGTPSHRHTDQWPLPGHSAAAAPSLTGAGHGAPGAPGGCRRLQEKRVRRGTVKHLEMIFLPLIIQIAETKFMQVRFIRSALNCNNKRVRVISH